MKWDRCIYANAYSNLAQLSLAIQQLHDQTAKVMDGRIDGHNLSPNILGPGLSFSSPPSSPPPHLPPPWPRKLTVDLADDETEAWVQKKGSSLMEEWDKPGLELVVGNDATYGRVCIVSSSDLSKQIGSFIPEDPATAANPKFEIISNYGKMRLGSNAAHNWELIRNGAVSFDDNGSRLKNYRSSLYLGGDDLSVERSAAGKLVLKDPSGSVPSPWLQFGGTASSHPALKRSGTTLEVRLADDSLNAAIATSNVNVGQSATTYPVQVKGTGDVGLHLGSNAEVLFSDTSADATATKDLGLSRSAAGKLLLKDPSGGVTTPGIQFNTSAVELKNEGTNLKAVLGSGAFFELSGGRIAMSNAGGAPGLHIGSSDAIYFSDSAVYSSTKDAGLVRAAAGVVKSTDGSTGFGDHAVKHLLGYGAATSYRTKIDFGTPSADKTITVPNRDVTMVGRAASGTSNKIIRFDSNGDAQDAGAEDDGTTISTARKVSVTGLFSATSGHVSGVNEEDLAANKTLVETSPTFQHLKSGAARDVNLPATPATGLLFHIHNYGSAAADLTVKTSGGSALATLSDGEWSWFQHVGGNSWQAWGLF